MTTKKLTRKQRILVATTLFGMFFGAGNLIFPVHLGQMAGSNVIPAIIGFIITAVGIPIFGVAAIGVTHSDGLQTLSGKVGKGYGIFFTCLLYLTIGPLFAIPRCATVSFTTGVSPMLPEAAQPLALLLFSAVFFAFVLFFSLRPGKITVWIGKIINPVFLLFLAVLVIAALLKPGASISDVAPTEPYATKTSAFFSSFIEGYGTMDAIAGLAFGIVVIDVIRRMGVDNDDAVAVDVLGSGVLTGLLMAVIYVVTILMGTQSRGLFEISDNGGIALTQIAGHYFGGVGQIILAVTITFACLKTSIGLVTSCSETFVKMTHGKISYKLWAILFTLFSFAVSNVGLSAIIEYSIPVLMLIYPPATALIILAFAGKLFRHDRAVYLSTMIFTWAAAIFDFFKTLPAGVRTALRLDAPVELLLGGQQTFLRPVDGRVTGELEADQPPQLFPLLGPHHFPAQSIVADLIGIGARRGIGRHVLPIAWHRVGEEGQAIVKNRGRGNQLSRVVIPQKPKVSKMSVLIIDHGVKDKHAAKLLIEGLPLGLVVVDAGLQATVFDDSPNGDKGCVNVGEQFTF